MGEAIEKRVIGKVSIGSCKKTEHDLLAYRDERGNYRQEVNGEDFDGHRVLWAFSYEPHTYLKESELSGEQYRKGGYMQITRNGLSVFKEFCRNPERAFTVMQYTLPKLQDFPFEYLEIGYKLYNHDQPAYITGLCDDGEIMVKTVDGKPFNWAFKQNDPKEDDEWGDKDRVHILSEHLYWHRN